jgi:8-oxo-dGTP diphosphatase
MHEFAAADQRYQDYRHCPCCGTAYRRHDFLPGPCVFICAHCSFDFYQNPVPAAVVVLADPQRPDAVLLLRRRTPPHIGRWCLPGGFIGYGESAPAAAARELREEVGVEARIGRVLHVGLIDYSYRGRQLCVLELCYSAQASGQLPPAGFSTQEASEIAFVPAREILNAPETLAFAEHVAVLNAFESSLDIR